MSNPPSARLLLLSNPFFHLADQAMKGRIQTLGYSPQPDGRGIQYPPLKSAHIGAIESAFGTQSLLGDPGSTANLGHNKADGFLSQVGWAVRIRRHLGLGRTRGIA